MPDGANADDNTENTGNTEEPETPSPADQVDQEIAATQVMEWWTSLFGLGDPHESGGGGTGGQYMFHSPEDLAAVITKWEDERDAIKADQASIAEAYYAIENPAGDDMSKGQATASKASLATMWEHNNAMLEYAEGYIAKLQASHLQMTTNEDSIRASMNNIIQA